MVMPRYEEGVYIERKRSSWFSKTTVEIGGFGLRWKKSVCGGPW